MNLPPRQGLLFLTRSLAQTAVAVGSFDVTVATKEPPLGVVAGRLVRVAEVRTGGRRIRGLDAHQRQARRRADLLEATLELVATKGYANTSIEQICQTAFVGTKSFYEIFDSKEACYLAHIEETSRQISERVIA